VRHTDALANLARLADHPELAVSARVVYMTLIIRTDDNGLCWPSVETIATTAGIVPANVRRHVAALVAAGLIAVERGGGRRHTNLYRLTVEVVPNPRGTARVSDDETRAVPRANPRATARKPARWRATNVLKNVEKNGRAAPPDPELDGHEHHRPGQCAECDAGRARVSPYSPWTPANDPRIGRW